MSTTLVWSNILAYSLQVGLLVAVAAFVPALVRMRAAGARLLYWQLLLAACLLLPWVRPWHREVIAASVSVTTVVTGMALPAPAPRHFHISPGNLLLYLLAAGVAARLAWLAVGLWRLRRYRRHAVPLENAGVWAEVLLSAEVSSPVTFGWRRPVILLPERFPRLSRTMQEAILCHENLHVERHDWLFTVAEELVRAALWFHPAIWWLLGEIQLAREQAVDWQVVRITQSRDPYVDALLEMAGARPELDLAPAPLFLRKRHLKQRVVEIIREATMSKTRWITALAASVVFLTAACWLVTGAFPLAAEPQMVSDAAGVAVDLGGAQLMHRSAVGYPAAAITKGVQGTVVALVDLDSNGVVTNATILSGPDELRKAVLESVLTWHFTKDAGATWQVSVTFELPKERAAVATGGAGEGVVTVAGVATEGSISHMSREQRIAMMKVAQAQMGFPFQNRVIKSIVVSGLSDQAKADLLARLPIHIGDTLTKDGLIEISATVQDLGMGMGVAVHPSGNDVVLQIALQSSPEFGVAPNGGTGASSGSAVAGGATSNGPDGSVKADRLLMNNGTLYTQTPSVLKSITVSGLSDQAKADLLARLPYREGDTLPADISDVMKKLHQAVAAFDEHLRASISMGNGQADLTIAVQGGPGQPRVSVNSGVAPQAGAVPQRIRVGGNVQAASLISSVKPEYPPLAKQANITGTVELQAIIDKDGHVQDLKVIRGHPLLVQSALDAVRNWVYKPTYLAGQPVEVSTEIDINFTLAQ